ncbi:MAG: helix-turn-helix domain-containing protein [Mycobacterium sp.]|nr:helix-turn-helix domain-containing protein [Mycobacterium sp.]
MTRPWIADLRPVADQSFPDSAVLRTRADELAALLGPGPTGWAVELGALMASRIVEAIPELAVDVVATEIRKGCEAVALGSLAALALDTTVSLSAMPEILTGPMEVVARGIGIEHMLRSIHIAHAAAAETMLDAAERLLPAPRRFTELRRINEVLFGIVDFVTERMAGEYTRAQEAWLTSSTALRMEIVDDILGGHGVPLDRANRILGYDLNRWHLAVIAWTGGGTPADPAQLQIAAGTALAAAGCVSTLVLPVGAQQVWGWGSRTSNPPELPADTSASPAPAVYVAAGLAAAGVDGFRRSHQQAAHAARVGAGSTRDEWLFSYRDVDIVAMLSADLPSAREFVARELGELAGSAESVAMMRHTLKSYLDRDRSLARTAAELHVARNTVAYRVQRAEQLRGRPATERRLQLHAALTLAEELGEAVLPSPDRHPTVRSLD